MIELATLARRLRAQERERTERAIRRALRARASPALPATPFVSLYERGRLIGCVGHTRLHDALSMARVDPRFGGARASVDEQTVQVSFFARPVVLPAAEALTRLELGRHGLIALEAGRAQGVLLPDVARDSSLDAQGMLHALARKLGRDTLDEVALVETERFVVRPRGARGQAPERLIDGAARWLSARVGPSGEITWGLDARSGRAHRTGAFHLGRASVVLAALRADGRFSSEVARARAWLLAEFRAALLGEETEGLSRAPAERAGGVALGARAGLPLEAVLSALVGRDAGALAESPWHAAQVVTVLGGRAPLEVVRAALAPLVRGDWAPWSVLAADTLGEAGLATSGRDRVARSLAREAPHPGGYARTDAGVTVPEVALTALAVEALAPSRAHAEAVRRGRSFLRAQAFASHERVPAALEPRIALGAFPLAPNADFLRSDVTAHALLALRARPERASR